MSSLEKLKMVEVRGGLERESAIGAGGGEERHMDEACVYSFFIAV